MRIGNALYFDHHATTPVDRRVLAKMLPYFTESFGNPHAADHKFGWEACRATESAAAQIARLIGADEDEIVFTSGATESNNLALLGLLGGAAAREKRRLVISSIDHKSTLAAARALQQRGVQITLLPVGADGSVSLDELERNLKSGPCLVSLSLVNSEIGTIEDATQIANLVRKHDAFLHWDAAQAPCAMDLTEMAPQADLISLSAHKMYGPKGVGALYIRRGIQNLFEPLIHGGGQQRNLRSGTLPTPLCVGFGAAAEILLMEDAARERERVGRLRDHFVALLREKGTRLRVNGADESRRHPGNANIRFDGISAHDLLGALQPKLAASTGSACASGIPEPSHVLRGIGLTAAESDSSIRFCIGRYTTDADIVEATALVSEAVSAITGVGLELI